MTFKMCWISFPQEMFLPHDIYDQCSAHDLVSNLKHFQPCLTQQLPALTAEAITISPSSSYLCTDNFYNIHLLDYSKNKR